MNMNRILRLISLILALMMSLPLLPASFAAEDDVQAIEEAKPAIPAEPEIELKGTEGPETSSDESLTETSGKSADNEADAIPLNEETDAEAPEITVDKDSEVAEPADPSSVENEGINETGGADTEPETADYSEQEEISDEEAAFIPCSLSEGCILADGHEGPCEFAKEDAFIPCSLSEGCVLADGHEGPCEFAKEDAFIPCSLSEGCILAEGHEGPCEFVGEDVFIPCSLSEGCILADGHEGPCEFAEEETVLPYGFPGMPVDFTLNGKQIAEKQALIDHNTVKELSGLVAGQHFVKKELLVNASSKGFAETVAAAYNAELVTYNGHFAVLRLKSATVPEAVAVAADLSNNMPAVSPNYIRTIEPIGSVSLSGADEDAIAVPKSNSWKDYKNSDPLLENPSASRYQWHHDMINSYEAWTTTRGSSKIKVAVIDSGVDTSHYDLQNITLKQVGSLPTGYTGSHGTHVAGIIGATLGNGKGGAGIASDVKIYSYRIVGADGSITNANECLAIYQAINDGVDIINMSLGGPKYDPVENAAIQDAYANGVTVVAAMGNDGTNAMIYPAGYDHVIAVGAVTPSGKRAYFSNYGSWCDISAPGENILSTYSGGIYSEMSGTSMATPVVSGVLALYMSKAGHISPSAALKKLKSSVTKCSSSGMGAGIIDASKLFSSDKTKPVLSVSVNGYTLSAKSGIPYDAEVTISVPEAATNDALILYTTNGKNPALANGEVSVGSEYAGPISLSDFGGKKLTIKAACVNDAGVLGSIASLTLTVANNPSPEAVSIRLGAFDADSVCPILCSGRALTFSAKIIPSDAKQSVTWSVTDLDGTARAVKIDAKGKLSCKASDSGTVRVTAKSKVNPDVTESVDVRIEPILPVSVIKINTTKAVIAAPGSLQLEVTTLTDKNKNDLIGSSDHLLSWSSSAPNIASVDQNGFVTVKGRGKASITCSVLDGSGKKATCAVNASQSVTSMTVDGLDTIAAGYSYTFKAGITPTNASKKTVLWSCTGNATIDKKGKLTVPKDTSGTVTVRADSTDGSGTYAERSVSVVQAGSYLEITGSSTDSDPLSTVKLSTYELVYSAPNTKKLYFRTDAQSTPVWTSSDPKIVKVDQSGNVTAVSNGTAVVTCTIPDGSGLKKSVKVIVGTPASSLDLESSLPRMAFEDRHLAYGVTVSHTLSFGDGYGKPTTAASDVEWFTDVYAFDKDGEEIDLPYFVENAVVWSEKARTLKITKNSTVESFVRRNFLYVAIQAHTTDGTNLYSDVVEYQIVPPTTYIRAEHPVLNCKAGKTYGIFPNEDYLTDCLNYEDVTIICSNPSIINYSGVIKNSDNSVKYYSFYCTKPGKATLTVKVNDGTGKSCKFTVNAY